MAVIGNLYIVKCGDNTLYILLIFKDILILSININMISKLLSPDKSNFLIKVYHKLNKLLIPALLPSLLLENDNNIKKIFDLTNLHLFGYHSYFSFSTIITDYHKKLPFIKEPIIRIVNFKAHSFLYIFISYNLYNKYYYPELYYYNYLKRRESVKY